MRSNAVKHIFLVCFVEVCKLTFIFRFLVSGDAGQGESPSSPDVTFSLDKDSFIAMFSGKLKPTAAFMQGKLKIKGDMMQAMKLETLMNKMKSKL